MPKTRRNKNKGRSRYFIGDREVTRRDAEVLGRKYGLSMWPLTSAARGVRDFVLRPIYHGVRLATAIPLRMANATMVKPLVRGTQVTSKFVADHPDIAMATAAAGLGGLAGAGYYRGVTGTSAQGMAAMKNVASDTWKMASPSMAAVYDSGKDIVKAVYNRDLAGIGKGGAKFIGRSLWNMPDMIYEGGQAIYDIGQSAGAAQLAAQNITNPRSWLDAFTASKKMHYNPITQRWVGTGITPAEIEKYRSMGLELAHKTEL